MAVEKAENELNQLSFLVWLDEFIRPRNSRSSFDDANQPSDDAESLDGDGTFNNDNNDDEQLESQQHEDSYVASPGSNQWATFKGYEWLNFQPKNYFRWKQKNCSFQKKIYRDRKRQRNRYGKTFLPKNN